MTKITIDEKACLKHKMTLAEALMALAIRHTDSLEDIPNMLAREIIVTDPKNDWYLVTQHWSDVLDEIICDSEGVTKTDEELLELAKRMRECFPQGKMPGTPYYYRCNNSEVVKKLKKFHLQYGSYPDDDIVDACRRFVASFHGNYRYLPLIKYFISKMKPETDEEGNTHNVEYSPLADYLENREEGAVVAEGSDDWLTIPRN